MALSLVAPAAALAAWPSDSTTNVAVCSTTDFQGFPAITSDQLGGAFIAWDDNRSDPLRAHVFVQHLTATGAVAPGWPVNGASACTTTVDQTQPSITGDGSGGAIVVWADARGGGHVFAQRLDAAGTRLWLAGGALLGGASNNLAPAIMSDGSGGAVVAWMDFRSGFNYDIYAQHVVGDGSVLWGGNGLPIVTTPEYQSNPVIASDDSGGAFIGWMDQRNGLNDIYAQRVAPTGTVFWSVNGIPVCTAPGNQWLGAMASDGQRGAFIGWEDLRADPNGDVYVHHLVGGGVDPSWPANGLSLVTLPSTQQGPPVIVADGDSGAVVAWSDYRGSDDIYAQRVNAAGVPQWAANGVRLGGGHSLVVGSVSDSAGGAILAIQRLPPSQPWDARAQRVSASGVPMWGPDGVAVSSAPHNQDFLALTADGAHGAILAWHDSRSDTGDVYAQNVNADGSLGGTVVAAELALVSADARPGLVALQWFSPDHGTATATLYRTGDGIDWTELATLAADGTGMLSYEDHDVAAENRYGYRLGVWAGGHEDFTQTAWVDVPSEFSLALGPPRPNPSSRAIQFRLTLPHEAAARVGIYDPTGRLVRELVHEQLDAGEHTLHWNADDRDGRPVPVGIYFIRAEVAGRTLSRRVALIR